MYSSSRYWEDEAHTRQAMRLDPIDKQTIWMHTGDEGILDEKGYLQSSFLILKIESTNVYTAQSLAELR